MSKKEVSEIIWLGLGLAFFVMCGFVKEDVIGSFLTIALICFAVYSILNHLPEDPKLPQE